MSKNKTNKLQIIIFLVIIICSIFIINYYNKKNCANKIEKNENVKIKKINNKKNEKQEKKKEEKNIKIKSTSNLNINNDYIGYIKIEKINLFKPLYKINSKKNNIEENVTILEGSIEPIYKNSILFLAAHSGYGKKAFFNNLNKLQINDIIKLNYNNINYNYIIYEKYEIEKIGYIEIEKEKENQLILTTCSLKNKNKQLVIKAIKK